MNWMTIAVTAALLALQAVVLSLLHNSPAQAEVVYRCGADRYQAQPCQDASAPSRALQLADARTEAQLAQALTQRHQIVGETSSTDSGHAKRHHRAPANQASALSAHVSGMAPFHNGQWLSDASKKPSAKDDRQRAHRQRTFTARAPKSSTAANIALANN